VPYNQGVRSRASLSGQQETGANEDENMTRVYFGKVTGCHEKWRQLFGDDIKNEHFRMPISWLENPVFA
jgi:hypothetical protein